MAIERTDTRGDGFPLGGHTLTVAEITKKRWPSGSVYYDFKFEGVVNNTMKTYQEKVAVWKAGPIIKALGGKEIEPGVFEWDREAVIRKQIYAEIVMEKDFKDPTKEYRKIKNPEPAGFTKIQNKYSGQAQRPPATVPIETEPGTVEEEIPF